MDKKTVFIKTAKGDSEGANLSSDLKRILSLIDSRSTVDELAKRAPPSLRSGCKDILGELEESGFIRDKNKAHVEPKITSPKFNPLKMFTPKPADDLDFNTPSAASVPNAAELAARQKEEDAARARVEFEAAVAAAKIRASADAAAKVEAQLKQEAEMAARAKALAESEAAAKAIAKAQKDAEIAARAKADAEAKAKLEAMLRMQAEARAKQEEAARLQAQQEAARAKAVHEASTKAKAEAEARVRAEIEAAARAQQEAESKAKREAEAVRLKAEQEAARIKVEQEAARVKAELAAAAKAKAEAEAALLKAEEEAARIRAELAAAKARAEAKALAEARVRQEAEEKARRDAEAARLKAEQEAARLRAEQEAAARLRAEAEAKALAEVAAKAAAEAKAIAEAKAAAEARANAEAKAAAEAHARKMEAEVAARREAEELARRAAALAEQEASARIAAETTAVPSSNASAFEINLDKFTGASEPVSQTFAPVAATEEAIAETEELKDMPEAVQATEKSVAAENGPVLNVAAEMARLKDEAEAARRKAEEDARRLAEELALAEEQAKAWAEAEQRAKTQSILETEQSIQQAALSQARATQKSTSRKRSKPLPMGKFAFGLVVLALITLVVLPYVYPLAEFIAPLEQRLSAQMKQPVHIGGMSAASLPPTLVLKNVTVGKSQEVKVGSVALSFDMLSLLSEIKTISNAELQDVSIEGNLLDKQALSLKLLGGDKQYPVRHLTLQRVKIVTDEVVVPILSGIADIDAQGAFTRVALHSLDDKLAFDLQPHQGRWQLGVSLKESSLFFMPDVVFSDLTAKGDLSDGEVNFTEMDAHIFNGILLGSAKLSWRKGWQLQGNLEAKTFDLDKMFQKYHVEGEMYGDGTFSMSGAKLSQMDDDPRLEGSFSVKKGTINIDIVETARLLSRDHLVGGRTRFDDLIGTVQMENHAVRIRQLKIISNMLSANGSFDVSSGGQLSGNLNAEIKMRAGNNQLTLFGSPVEPKLRAGR